MNRAFLWGGLFAIALGAFVFGAGLWVAARLALSAEGLHFTRGLYPVFWWAVGWGNLVGWGIAGVFVGTRRASGRSRRAPR